MSSPRVSVIIPCYNQAHYLAGCIDSALAQGVDAEVEPEVIVVDDGSPDETPQVAARYGERIRYQRQANAGLAAARNAGIALATGEFLVFLDSDDELHAGGLAAHVAALSTRPDAGVSCGAWVDVDPAGKELAAHAAPDFGPDPLHTLLTANQAPPVAHCFRADAVRRAGGFGRDPRLYGHEDWALLLKLAADRAGFVGVPAPVARYRIDPRSMSFTAKRRMNESGIHILRDARLRHAGCATCAAIVSKSLAIRAKFRVLHRLLDGERGSAATAWLGGIAPLLAGGEWRFVVAVPLLLATPLAALRRRYAPRPVDA